MRHSELQNFRINYPYGIVMNLETKSFAMFNRDYMPIGFVANESKKNRYNQTFFPNDNITPEFIEYWQSYIKSRTDMDLQVLGVSDDDKIYHQLWLYNDRTNPYIRGYILQKDWKTYMHRLEKLAGKLQVDVSVLLQKS